MANEVPPLLFSYCDDLLCLAETIVGMLHAEESKCQDTQIVSIKRSVFLAKLLEFTAHTSYILDIGPEKALFEHSVMVLSCFPGSYKLF